MPLIVDINMRHTDTGKPIRTLGRFNDFTLNLRHNSLASTFSFSFLYDPFNKDLAEMFCISHIHECILYYTSNTNVDYKVTDDDRVLTGYLKVGNFRDFSKPQLTVVSGYSKAGILNKCSHPPDITLESEGLSLEKVIRRSISRFDIGFVYDKSVITEMRSLAKGEDLEEAGDGDDEEDVGKSTPDGTQFIGSYITELTKARNIVLNSDRFGRLQVSRSNTQGNPLFTLDFTDGADSSIYRKIPGVEADLEFNAESLHSHITVKMQADEDEDSNGAQITVRNPFIPVNTVYMPITHTIESGSEFTVKRAAKYEMSKEIREAIKMNISFSRIDIDGKLITPNNVCVVRNPKLYLYNLSRWFIQSVDIKANEKGESATISCVPPFAYDFDSEVAKNMFVDPHKNSGLK